MQLIVLVHCTRLSITPKRKKGMMHFLRSALRQPRMETSVHFAMHASHLSVNTSLCQSGQGVPNRTPYHILFLCVVNSKKFPRLLAEREIIANALLLTCYIAPSLRLAASGEGSATSACFPCPLRCSRGKDTKFI